jgi:hypothetical protein
LRNLKVDVTVFAVNTHVLQKCLRNMEHLQFATRSGRVPKNDDILRPTENGVYRRLYWSQIRNWDMLLVVAEIGCGRFKRYAFAKILRLNLTKIDTPAR